MIYVIATIEIAEGRRDDFLNEFRKIIPAVRAEDGCIEYGPAIDTETGIDAQQPLRENVVTVMEKWESVDALKAHLVAPHMLEYRPKVKDIVLSTRLEILEPA
ncbi:MAG: putative quinol monooxygenase [Planctomycetaceae bacterium]